MEEIEIYFRLVLSEINSREELCIALINKYGFRRILEIGVWQGEFSYHLLTKCPSIAQYYLLDPWRHLDGWNKPANISDADFESMYEQVISRTSFASDKCHFMRGTTLEKIHDIEDSSLEFIYIDGDHTLKGITIDLINSYRKIQENGIIVGDDFTTSIWQHSPNFEPTFVFPFAVHFAQAVGAHIFAFPFNQFAIIKTSQGYKFTDLVGTYTTTELRFQMTDLK